MHLRPFDRFYFSEISMDSIAVYESSSDEESTKNKPSPKTSLNANSQLLFSKSVNILKRKSGPDLSNLLKKHKQEQQIENTPNIQDKEEDEEETEGFFNLCKVKIFNVLATDQNIQQSSHSDQDQDLNLKVNPTSVYGPARPTSNQYAAENIYLSQLSDNDPQTQPDHEIHQETKGERIDPSILSYLGAPKDVDKYHNIQSIDQSTTLSQIKEDAERLKSMGLESSSLMHPSYANVKRHTIFSLYAQAKQRQDVAEEVKNIRINKFKESKSKYGIFYYSLYSYHFT